MIFFKIILILIVINKSAVCFKSSDFCIKPDPKLKCNEQLSYSCNDKLCAPGKEYCQFFINTQILVNMVNV
jgi:hypothetical protein